MTTANEASQQANRSGLDPRRLVVIFLLLAGLVLSMLLNHVFQLLWSQLAWADPELVEGLGWRLTTLLGVILSAGIALGIYLIPRSHQLAIEISTELMKVRWPNWEEVRVSTVAVVVASLVAAVILFGMDAFALKVMTEWLPKVWGRV